MSTLLWVPVPGGRVGEHGRPLLRVLVTPRLDGPLTGAMTDWPAAVHAGASAVTVSTRPAGGAAADAVTAPGTLRRVARSDVWKAFFGGITVRPFTAPAGYDPPAVRPTSRDASAVRTTYQQVAEAVGAPGAVRAGLAPWDGDEAAPTPRTPTEPPCDPPDLHRAVALLREHPQVLRLLGLVLELDVEAGALPPGRGTHDVSVTWPGSPVPVEARWTRYELDGTHFLPASAGDVVSGLVDLSDAGRWQVVTFDVDGGVGRLRSTARSVLHEQAPAVDGRPRLPTLRSAGLQLTRVGRDAQLAARAAHGRGAHDPDRALTAEDLVLGYRLDVRPEDSSTWFSLHRRDVRYTVGALPPVEVLDEEGHVKPFAVVKDDEGLHTDEVVARWDGWSLSVPRPPLGRRARAPRRSSRCPMPYEFEAHSDVVTGSLPELEFGRAYQLRARVVDLAGGGLELDDPLADTRATRLEPYVRYEPVPPPEVAVPDGLLVPGPTGADDTDRFVLAQGAVGPGGSVDRLVVRSAPDAAGEHTTVEFDADAAHPPNHSRRLLPPRTTFALAEQHGVLRGTDADTVARVDRALAGTRADRRAAGAADPARTLPDPVALGVAATLLPEPGVLAGEVTDSRPWGGTWPDLEPKDVEVVAGRRPGVPPRVRWVAPEPGDVDAESRRVLVELAPGDRVVLELTSTVAADDVDTFAVNQLVGTPTPGATPTAAQQAVVNGRHPLLMPPRRLECVHAVRRPVATPAGTATAVRAAGETVVRYVPDDPLLGVHVPSTGQVEVLASWDEWDDAATPATRSALLPPVALERGATALPGLRQELGDTRHRVVDLTVTAVSRYRDCFATPAVPPPGDGGRAPGEVSREVRDAFSVTGTVARVSVPSSARPAPPRVAATVPAFTWAEAREPGSVVRTRGGGLVRVELTRPWFTTGEGEALGVVVWPGSEDDLPADLRERVTRLNRDPLHPTAVPAVLPAASVFGPVEGALDCRLPVSSAPVRVLPYPVFEAAGRWWADVAVPGAVEASYAPFVRLALVRFQAASLVAADLTADPDGDLRVSDVVLADVVPLLPERRLEVRQDAAGCQVTLTGVTRGGPLPNRVVVELQRASLPGAELATHTGSTTSPPAVPVWTTVATAGGVSGVPLPPLSLPEDAGTLRLLVRETEDLGEPGAPLLVGAAVALRERTVYLDTVELPVP